MIVYKGSDVNIMKTVCDLKINESGVVVRIGGSGALRRRIIDMGITPGAIIVMKRVAPFGDPIELNVRGYELSIRKSEAKEIVVNTNLESEVSGHNRNSKK